MSSFSVLPDVGSNTGPSLKLSLLSEVDIFRDLSKEEVEEIASMTNMVTCKKGYIFYRPDEQAEVLFLLKKGKVQVYTLTPEGKRLIVEAIGPGTFFGEMPLTAQSMHQSFAEATEDSTICVLSRYDMERLILQKPRVAVRLLDALSRRLQETQSRLEETALRNATARVCRMHGEQAYPRPAQPSSHPSPVDRDAFRYSVTAPASFPSSSAMISSAVGRRLRTSMTSSR